MTPPPSPTAWLWAELTQRLGTEAAQQLHDAYLAQCRAYYKARRGETTVPGGARKTIRKRP